MSDRTYSNGAESLGLPNIPADWLYKELGDLLQDNGLSYGIVQPGSEDPAGVPVLRVKNVRNGRVLLHDVLHVSKSVEAGYQRTRLSGGEVLLSLVGSVGEVAIAPPMVSGWNVARAIAVIRAEGSVQGSWIRLCLESDLAQRFMRMWQTTTVQATLNLRDVRRLPIVLPPGRERDAITAVIAALDDKIDVNNRTAGSALALGDAFFIAAQRSSALRSDLSELAAEGMLTFGDGYRTKRSEHGRPGLPILRVAEVSGGRVAPDFIDFVSDRYRAAMGGKISRAGDVILTTKGTVGRVAVLSEKDPTFVYSPQLCYFRVPAGSVLSSSYLYFWLRSGNFWEQAKSRKSQTDMADYLSLTDIRKLAIPVPASESRQRDSVTLRNLLAKTSGCHAENNHLIKLRNLLLPKLMSGEIRVRDAEKVVEDVT